MCGIVGLYLKNPKLQPKLGEMFKPMLIEMTSRGPDSAGVAIYRNPVKKGLTKFSLAHDDPKFEWKKIDVRRSRARPGSRCSAQQIGNHAILTTNAKERAVVGVVEGASSGGARRRLRPGDRDLQGDGPARRRSMTNSISTRPRARHIIGHTRMATESAVTTAGSHPFATGADLCLVHNGSLSNHNRLRENLKREGLEFQTENDTEVAAAYMTWKLRQGAIAEGDARGRHQAISTASTRSASARMTDSPWCAIRSPASMRSLPRPTTGWRWRPSIRAIAHLPGADKAKIWEPAPQTIYNWGGH